MKAKLCNQRIITMICVIVLAITSVNLLNIKASAETKKIGIQVSKVSIGLGKTYNLKGKITNLSSNAKVTYKVSNKNVLVVNTKGLASALEEGKSTITINIVQSNNKYSFKVEVTVKYPKVTPGDELIYRFTDTGISIVGVLDDKIKSIVIPKKIEGYNVVSIGENAFENNTKLESIIIPNSIIEINEGAFKNCKNLKSVFIPSSVGVIGKNAFSFCYAIESIRIPNSVTEIQDGAFNHCIHLKSITIPSSLSLLGYMSFSDCYSLESATISGNNLDMSDWGKGTGFQYCKNLTTVNIKKGVTKVDFYECPKLSNITLSEGVTMISISSEKLGKISIPSTLEDIYLPDTKHAPKISLVVYPNSEGESYAMQRNIPYTYKK